MRKHAPQDVAATQRRVPAGRIAHIIQTKQRRPPDRARAVAPQQIVQPTRLCGQPGAAFLGPAVIRQGRRADLQRRPRYRPGAKHFTHYGDHVGCANGKTQAQPGKSPELAETFQHNRARPRGQRDMAVGRGRVAEALVDHQQRSVVIGPTIPRVPISQAPIPQPPVGIVRVDDHPGRRPRTSRRDAFDHLPAGMGKGGGVFIVTAPAYLYLSRWREQRNPGNQCRGARCRQYPGLDRNVPETAGRIDKRLMRIDVGQGAPVARLQRRQGKWARVDAGGKIDPIPGRAPEPASRPIQGAAMFTRLSRGRPGRAVPYACRHHALQLSLRAVQADFARPCNDKQGDILCIWP